jgi:hypothetical protein
VVEDQQLHERQRLGPVQLRADRELAQAPRPQVRGESRPGWCGVERRVDVPTQRWETRLLVCDHAPDLVADARAEEIGHEPGSDARRAGVDRRTLARNDAIATAVCYVAGAS